MQVKVCPSCGAEYFAHFEECADCHVKLKLPEEINERGDEDDFADNPDRDAVPIREGSGPWLKEVHRALQAEGINSTISLTPGCSPGSCSSTCLLFVAKEDVEAADACIKAYYVEAHPEMADDLAIEGEDHCPACGHATPQGAKECPDCGLVLVFEE